MQRRREAASNIRCAIEELTVNFKTDHGATTSTAQLPIKPFLSLCNLLMIQALDKIGPTMAVLRQDIHQNIEAYNAFIPTNKRLNNNSMAKNKPAFLVSKLVTLLRLEKFHSSDPSIYWDVVAILKKEFDEGNAKKGPTCSKAFVWLTRSLDFTLALLQLLVKDVGRNMEQAVEESYTATLKPWHGWISSAAYRVALKLVPDGHTLVNTLKANDEDYDMLKEEIQHFISLLEPVLQKNADILRTYGLDRLKST